MRYTKTVLLVAFLLALPTIFSLPPASATDEGSSVETKEGGTDIDGMETTPERGMDTRENAREEEDILFSWAMVAVFLISIVVAVKLFAWALGARKEHIRSGRSFPRFSGPSTLLAADGGWAGEVEGEKEKETGDEGPVSHLPVDEDVRKGQIRVDGNVEWL
jgi:hypothetical protein